MQQIKPMFIKADDMNSKPVYNRSIAAGDSKQRSLREPMNHDGKRSLKIGLTLFNCFIAITSAGAFDFATQYFVSAVDIN